jgi:Domain of unknown function (DUF4189)
MYCNQAIFSIAAFVFITANNISFAQQSYSNDKVQRVEGDGPLDIDPETGWVRTYKGKKTKGAPIQIFDKNRNRYRRVTPKGEQWKVFDSNGNEKVFDKFIDADDFMRDKNVNPDNNFKMKSIQNGSSSTGKQKPLLRRKPMTERPYVNTDKLVQQVKRPDLNLKSTTKRPYVNTDEWMQQEQNKPTEKNTLGNSNPNSNTNSQSYVDKPADQYLEETTNFAAIAYSKSTRKWGWAVKKTREEAEAAALSYCRTSDAKTAVWSEDAWCALARGDDGSWGAAWGKTRKEAELSALRICRKWYTPRRSYGPVQMSGGGPSIKISVNATTGKSY